MIRANLIPAARQEAKQQRARRRAWLGVCGAYAGLLLTGYALCAAAWGADGRGLQDQLANEEADIKTSKAELGTLHQKLEQARRKLQANRAVGDQPDWSVLLAVLASSLDDELVLTLCKLHELGQPAEPRPPMRARGVPPAAAPAGQEQFLLTIGGYARSQAAVSQFVLRLERGRLFRTVNLLKANREPFLAGSAVAFRVECSL
ncbi:MAG: hypothetical protein AMJ81_12915 [Phycisphaerae bacterium SM23_33]|nr:MAG: hypothetical protein AMJ81_12915 [Phycisphaerae bacterium SM23_33]